MFYDFYKSFRKLFVEEISRMDYDYVTQHSSDTDWNFNSALLWSSLCLHKSFGLLDFVVVVVFFLLVFVLSDVSDEIK
jgi:hypothetical protein